MKKEYKALLHELKLQRYAITHPNYPQDYIPKTMYKDSTANGLTKAICDFINYQGYQAERINTMGTAREKKTTAGKVIGVTWTKGTSTAGSATYYIARNFDDFVNFFNDFVNKYN